MSKLNRLDENREINLHNYFEEFRKELKDLKNQLPDNVSKNLGDLVDSFEDKIKLSLDKVEQKEAFDDFINSFKDILEKPELIEYREIVDILKDKVEELKTKVTKYYGEQLKNLQKNISPDKLKEKADKGRKEAKDSVENLVSEAFKNPNFNLPGAKIILSKAA